MPIAWFDQPGSALLCEHCLAEYEESEETSEHFDECAILPGQIEMTLTIV